MYPEKLKVIAQQVQLQQQQEQVRLLHQEKLEREQHLRTQVGRWPREGPWAMAGQGLHRNNADILGSQVSYRHYYMNPCRSPLRLFY